jgi:membrane protein
MNPTGPDLKRRFAKAGRLATDTWREIKDEWTRSRSRRVAVVAFAPWKHLRVFFLALGVIFPSFGRLMRFCWGVAKRFYHNDCFSYAAGLSFWILISLAPLVTLLSKLLIVFLGGNAYYEQTIETIREVIPFMPDGFLRDTVDHSRELGNNMGFTWGVLLFGSYWGMMQLDTSLSHVFGVRVNKDLQTRKNNLLRQIALLVGGALMLSLLLAWIIGGTVWDRLPNKQSAMANYMPIAICIALATIIFQFIPRVHVAFRHALIGGLVVTFFWVLARWGFRVYLNHAFTWGIMYGSLLGIIAGLTFLYYTSAILLLGAEVTAALCRRKRKALGRPRAADG